VSSDVKHLHLASRDHQASLRFYETYFGFRYAATLPPWFFADPDGHLVQVYFDPDAA
jgi:hypothetical protein